MSDDEQKQPEAGEFYRVREGDQILGASARSRSRALPPCLLHTPIANRQGDQIVLYASVHGAMWICRCAVCGQTFILSVDEARRACEIAIEGARIAMGLFGDQEKHTP